MLILKKRGVKKISGKKNRADEKAALHLLADLGFLDGVRR